MYKYRSIRFLTIAWILPFIIELPLYAQVKDTTEKSNTIRIQSNQLFHHRSTQSPGLLIPLYIYPENIHTNAAYNRVIELKREYPTIPFWVIVNPDSGPGKVIDENYVKAIDRLIGSGCIVIGYVTTNYGKKSVQNVAKELKVWQTSYPRIHGIFFDEMIYEDNAKSVGHQGELNSIAHQMGYWPTVGNPGTDTPGRYFAQDVADVIVIHEADEWPTEKKLQGDYFGGYSDYPPYTRATLMYSQTSLDPKAVKMAVKYTRWIYVTDDKYKVNDPMQPNPWDNLSEHLKALCETLGD